MPARFTADQRRGHLDPVYVAVPPHEWVGRGPALGEVRLRKWTWDRPNGVVGSAQDYAAGRLEPLDDEARELLLAVRASRLLGGPP